MSCLLIAVLCHLGIVKEHLLQYNNISTTLYSKTCVRQPPLKLTLVVDVER